MVSDPPKFVLKWSVVTPIHLIQVEAQFRAQPKDGSDSLATPLGTARHRVKVRDTVIRDLFGGNNSPPAQVKPNQNGSTGYSTGEKAEDESTCQKLYGYKHWTYFHKLRTRIVLIQTEKNIEAKITQIEENMLNLQRELEEKINQINQSTLYAITKGQESLVDQIVNKLVGLCLTSAPGTVSSEGEAKTTRVEITIKLGGRTSEKLPLKKKEREIINISKSFVAVPSSRKEPRKEKEHFDHIPMTYKELYQQLVSPYPKIPLKPLYPKWYDRNVHCEYHGSNPLPNHQENKESAITEEKGKEAKTRISEVKSPLAWVWKQMINAGFLAPYPSTSDSKGGSHFCYHNEDGHDVQECVKFIALIQLMMDRKEMKFYDESNDTPKAERVMANEAS
ncbi:hypothetical protein F3Y22_tig00003969pilonHSYRG00022 [Hibiscus syriacus]|uniref:Uncharacterized protein n=1 Tax=Hibiscus syriacus TaxID=106335 RepID=A0A6A3CK84_HIBSY|nr:hypothetical protein F3Y22_tig00003969pilonHSYRG00022 [Hibiscus syriacus]